MPLRILKLPLLFLLLAVTCMPANAARVALVLGNANYQEASPLSNPLNDARDMANALRSVGFQVFEGYDLGRAETLALVEDFARALKPEDTALLYYAGHGVQLGAENYLVPVDAKSGTQAELADGSVKLQSILRTMELRANSRIVILDACRNNPYVRSIATRSGAAPARGLAKVEAGIGSFIAFSTQPGNTASDGNSRNSPFTAALLQHISSPGQDIHAVMRSVRADVHDNTGGTQTPWENSSLVREFFFVPPAANPAPAPAPAPATAPAPQPTVPAKQFHYVGGLDPNGDNFLALRSAPAGAGYRILKMGPGTQLEVLGQRGKWLNVRMRDGTVGWAHGNWVHCCRGGQAAPPPAPAPSNNVQLAESCESLWFRRNAIWHRHGYCFGSARGQAAFDNSSCFRNQAQTRAAMSRAERKLVNDIARLEKARGCR